MPPCLLVAATRLEVAPLVPALGLEGYSAEDRGARIYVGSRGADMLISGVGQMQTAYHLGKALQQPYAAAINFGIAGSFSPKFSKCSVVQVVQEELADLGAEDNGTMLDLFQMKLLEPDLAPFKGGALHAAVWNLRSLSALPKVRSITVNRVLGTAESVEAMRTRYNPDVVNMEGAAFLFACARAGVPSLELRAISDQVGPRDKGTWDIPGAVRAVCAAVQVVLEELLRMPVTR